MDQQWQDIDFFVRRIGCNRGRKRENELDLSPVMGFGQQLLCSSILIL
jgi:hypothetical protein